MVNILSEFEQSVFKEFAALPQSKCWILAYSGGIDSAVLLDLAVSYLAQKQNIDLLVVHINHQINPDADTWEQFCAQQCQHYQVAFKAHKSIVKKNKKGLEAAAREARYGYLASVMHEGDIVLTAHHQNDQVETYLLHLLRGSGVSGLSSMSVIANFKSGWLVRPLLTLTRAAIHHYAELKRLKFIHDVSNDDITYDRNYLRHNVIPVLLKKWPAALQTISRSIQHHQQTSVLINELAVNDLALVSHGDLINTNKLLELSNYRAQLVLRSWLHQLKLPSAHEKHLQLIINTIKNLRSDSEPLITWPGVEIRYYQGMLYAMQSLVKMQEPINIAWDGKESLQLPLNLGKLWFEFKDGLPEDFPTLICCFRYGGERIKPAGGQHTRELKKLFQEYLIPPWLRNRMPLLWHRDKLIAVANWWLTDEFSDYLAKHDIKLKFSGMSGFKFCKNTR